MKQCLSENDGSRHFNYVVLLRKCFFGEQLLYFGLNSHLLLARSLKLHLLALLLRVPSNALHCIALHCIALVCPIKCNAVCTLRCTSALCSGAHNVGFTWCSASIDWIMAVEASLTFSTFLCALMHIGASQRCIACWV